MKVRLRNYPYPYRSMFAICSDLDETPNSEVYFEICRYLNTTDDTRFGSGVGLEVGNSIYFDMPKGQFSYWNTDDQGREKIRKLIASGHIDSLHSFGDYVRDRESIERNWNELVSSGCIPKIWIDHARAITNIDTDIMCGEGAMTGANAYHTDLTFTESGIEYVWKGRVTSIVSQNTHRCYEGLFNSSHPLTSAKTIIKEYVKGVLGRFGNAKYAMHADNKVLRQTTLAGGVRTWEFMRTNPSWAGVSTFDKGKDIGRVITDRILDSLVRNSGCSILYTHLGKVSDLNDPFGSNGRRAFESLSKRYINGDILVLTTKRLLDYIKARESVVYEVKNNKDRVAIKIDSSQLGGSLVLDGLTWYVPDPSKVDVYINDIKIEEMQHNKEDASGMPSVSIPLTRLSFPAI